MEKADGVSNETVDKIFTNVSECFPDRNSLDSAGGWRCEGRARNLY
jgi:hypothetical protein